jgi:hypothetical protein
MSIMTAPATWPNGPAGGSRDEPHDYAPEAKPSAQMRQDQGQVQAAVADMAQLLRETRDHMLATVGMLGSIAIGISLEARFATRALQPGMFRVLNIGLTLGLLFCWLTAVTLLLIASRPVLHALSELRWVTGSPLDPRAKWLTLPPLGTNPEEWTWTRAHLLLGAAWLVRCRIECAQTWASVATAAFIAWTAIIIMGF